MLRQIQDIPQKCLICGQQCANRRSLGNHLARSHPEVGGQSGYVTKYLCDAQIPLCGCGCGSEVTWHRVLNKFNDFVNGHNPAGFKVTTPVASPEFLSARADKIRETYRERGTEIKQRISAAVRESLSRSDFDFSAHMKHVWADHDFRQRAIETRRLSWRGDKGDQRRKKTFTPEFRQKISLLNSSRDLKKPSHAEQEFVKHVKEFLPSVKESKWFNFDEKTWCVDLYDPDSATLIEFDGVFYHGLDRDQCFAPVQILNMGNDLWKNWIARERGLSLIRVSEDSQWRQAHCLEDLIFCAHHVVSKGSVEKEGTRRLRDRDVIVTRDAIVNLLTQEKGRDKVEEKYLRPLKNFLRGHCAYWGWFYPTCQDDVIDVMRAVAQSTSVDRLSGSSAGSAWLQSRVRSFWDVSDGPARATQDDEILGRVLRYRLGLNDSSERFDVSLREVRRGLIVTRNRVSWFKPQWAAHVYRKFLTGVASPVVWDPAVGFSARMLGFASMFDNGRYVGCEPASRIFADADDVADELRSVKSGLSFDVRNTGSEFCSLTPDSIDLAFTSPPYFDAERYFDEAGQCWRDYPEFDVWVQKFLVPTVTTAYSALKRGRFLVFNVPMTLLSTLEEACVSVGFSRRSDLDEYVTVNRDHFNKGKSVKREVFAAFQKS